MLLVVGEGEVVEVVGGPELGRVGDGVDDLCVELRGGADAEDVAVDDLDETELAVVAGHVEGLGLDVGRVHDLPAHVGLCELGEGHIFALLRDGLDGFGAVFTLGDADAVREEGMLVRFAHGTGWRGRSVGCGEDIGDVGRRRRGCLSWTAG